MRSSLTRRGRLRLRPDGLPGPTELAAGVRLADLKMRDVQFALGTLAERSSARSVRLARMILIQASRSAMVNDLAVRNVAELAAVPTGEPGQN
jgi:hypothetical protein